MTASPPDLAEDKANATPMWDDHPAHHNALADVANVVVAGGVSVREYGALGDGTTDDSAAFRLAANAAHAYGSILHIPPGRYALAHAVDLTGLHGLVVRGSGAASVLLLVGDPQTQDAFVTTAATNHLAFHDLAFDGSQQLAVVPVAPPAVTGGHAIFLAGGGTDLLCEGLSGSRLNCSLVRATGYTEVVARRIRVVETAWQQPSPILSGVVMSGLWLEGCTRIFTEDVYGRDCASQHFQLITVLSGPVVGGTAPTDVVLRDTRGFHLGNLQQWSFAGGALIGVYGFPTQGTVPQRVIVSGAVCVNGADSNIWVQGDHVQVSDFDLSGAYGGGLELLGRDIRVANGSVRGCQGRAIWVHCGAFDPSAAEAGGFGPMNTADVTIAGVQIEDCTGAGGTGIFIDNREWNATLDPPATLTNVTLDDVRIKRTRQDAITLNHVLGVIHGGHVELEDANLAAAASTTITVTPDGTSAVIQIAPNTHFIVGDYLQADGLTMTGYRVGAVVDATHLSLCDNTGVTLGTAGAAVPPPNGTTDTHWAIGKTLKSAYAGSGALTLANDASQVPLAAHFDDLVVRDTGAPPATLCAIAAANWAAPLKARVTTVGAFPLSVLSGGSVLELLPGARLNGVDGLLLPVGPLRLVDDFAGGSNTSGSIGQLGWAFGYANLAAGGSITRATTAVGHVGIATVNPGTTVNTVYALYSANYFQTNEPNVSITFLVWASVLDANQLVRLGVANDPIGPSPPTNGWWLELAYGGANWELVVSNTALGQVRVSLGVPPNAAWHTFRLRKTGGTVFASVDGGAEVSLSTNLPAALGCSVFAHSGQNGGGANKPLHLDRVAIEFPTLARA